MDGVTPSLTLPTGVALPSAAPAPGGRSATQLAEEFEAMFLLQILRQMRHSFLEEPEPDQGLGLGTMTDTFDEELSRDMSRSGGVGLAKVLIEHIPGAGSSRLASPAAGAVVGGATPPVAPAADLVASTAVGDATLPLVPLEAPVSSAFGWRSDPLLGTPRFHKGIDLKAAYGREVPAAAAGRVTFAGEQGGYGQTVVVEHAGGFTTRYAHLSSIAVSAGQQLADGVVIGRVGQSGRATGPHLHFEVTRDGKALDPAELGRLASDRLKIPGGGVDFPFDAASLTAVSIGADHEG